MLSLCPSVAAAFAAGVAAMSESAPRNQGHRRGAGDSDAMRQSIEAGYPVMLNEVGGFSGRRGRKAQVGEKAFALCRDLLDEIVTVDTDAICGAIKGIFLGRRVVAGTGWRALSLAGLTAWVEREKLRDRFWPQIVSSANMNFDRLGRR